MQFDHTNLILQENKDLTKKDRVCISSLIIMLNVSIRPYKLKETIFLLTV